MLKELYLVQSIHHFRCINIKDTWRTQRSIPMNTIQEFLFLIIDNLCFLYVTFCSVMNPTGSGKNTTASKATPTLVLFLKTIIHSGGKANQSKQEAEE